MHICLETNSIIFFRIEVMQLVTHWILLLQSCVYHARVCVVMYFTCTGNTSCYLIELTSNQAWNCDKHWVQESCTLCSCTKCTLIIQICMMSSRRPRFSFPGGRVLLYNNYSACKFAQYIKHRISRDIPQSAVFFEYNFIIVNRVVVL